MSDMKLQTRRSFLRSGLVGGALTWTVPSFLATTMNELHAASSATLQAENGKEGPILVVLQLAGGNDGLNAVVPYSNDDYYRARPQLGIAKKDCLALNDNFGWHPALKGLHELYTAGDLAVIQGVGYPNPNRSHFRSMEIWQTASDSDRYERHGWIGRYFDNHCRGEDAGVAVCLGKETPQAFAASNPKGITFKDPNRYRFVGVDEDDMTAEAESGLFAAMNLNDADAGASIGSLGGSSGGTGSENPLDFLERTALDAQVSSDSIRGILRSAQNPTGYPNGRLANDLKSVSKMIAGGLPTRIYYVSQGGYDTHTNQRGAHERLLTEFGDSLDAFIKDLRKQGNLNRVMVMVFSEFGRRVAENASGGTDHGAAAPMFLVGGNTLAGVHGTLPSLAPKDLLRGDLQFNTDFRSVYATVLERHLKVPNKKILRNQFPVLNVIG